MYLSIMTLINISQLTSLVLMLSSLVPRTKGGILPGVLNASYWEERNRLMSQDFEEMLGHELELSPDEHLVDAFLMGIKQMEVDHGFQTLNFFPSLNFLEVKSDIDRSPVFNFLRKMPKGAVLHSHDMALTSVGWVISNLTYWDDLYMCNSTDGYVLFRFFLTPDDSCNWTLVSEERANHVTPEEFDSYLQAILSLHTTDVSSTYPDINSIWGAFEQIFRSLSGLLSYHRAWQSYLDRALQEMMEDGVSYLEFRGVLPLLYDKDGRIYTAQETVGVYHDVIGNFTARNSDNYFGARFIYAPPRSVDVDTVSGYVELVIQLRDLYPTTVAGFDLVGQEDLGEPLISFIDPLLTLSQQDPPVPVFFHAGETNWEGMATDENLFDAILLNSSRIGHAYALSKHPVLMRMVKEKEIPIEVCPISNQILMLVSDLRNHPMSSLSARSFPIVVSSDDPGLWGALPLSHDFYEAFMGLGGAKADLKFLKKLALNSIRYSSLNNNEKISLETMWQAKWENFVNEVLLENNLIPDDPSNIIPEAEEEESNEV